MSGLAADRNTLRRIPGRRSLPMAASKIYAGGIVVINAAGYAEAATTAAAKVAVGRAFETVDLTGGAAGALTIEVEVGTFQYDNSASGDLIALPQIGTTCYLVDDHTVAKTSNSAARSAAGTVFDVDADGVWVTFN